MPLPAQHSPLFDIDEGALKVGAQYLASLAHEYLAQRRAPQARHEEADHDGWSSADQHFTFS